MNTIFIDYENSKTSDPHRLMPNLTGKISLLYQILAFAIYGKI